MNIVIVIIIVTSTECLSLRDLREVQTSLWEARHRWKQIGLAIGISITTLEAITQTKFHDVDKCFKSMLSIWLNSDSPCWKTMAEALQSKSVAVRVQKQTITAKEAAEVKVSTITV